MIISTSSLKISTISVFEPSSKRRRGYPSEKAVKRGVGVARRRHRFVHGNKELQEKLGNNDLCLCGSGRCFQKVLSQ